MFARYAVPNVVSNKGTVFAYFLGRELAEVEAAAAEEDQELLSARSYLYVEYNSELSQFRGLHSKCVYDRNGRVLEVPRGLTLRENGDLLLRYIAMYGYARNGTLDVETMNRSSKRIPEIAVAQNCMEHLHRSACEPELTIESPVTQEIVAKASCLEGLNVKTLEVLKRSNYRAPFSLQDYEVQNIGEWSAHRRACEVLTSLLVASLQRLQYDLAWGLLQAVIKEPWIDIRMLHGPILELLYWHQSRYHAALPAGTQRDDVDVMLNWLIMNYPAPTRPTAYSRPNALRYYVLSVMRAITRGDYKGALTLARDILIAPPYSMDATLFALAGLASYQSSGLSRETRKMFDSCAQLGGRIPHRIAEQMKHRQFESGDSDMELVIRSPERPPPDTEKTLLSHSEESDNELADSPVWEAAEEYEEPDVETYESGYDDEVVSSKRPYRQDSEPHPKRTRANSWQSETSILPSSSDESDLGNLGDSFDGAYQRQIDPDSDVDNTEGTHLSSDRAGSAPLEEYWPGHGICSEGLTDEQQVQSQLGAEMGSDSDDY